MGWGIVKPPLWLFLQRFLTRCETMTWHSARAAESVLRQGNKWRNEERISQQPLGQVSASLWLASLLRAVIMPPAGGPEWRTPSACMCGRLCVLSFIRRNSAEVHLSFLRAGAWLKERETPYKEKVHTDRWRAAAGKCFWKTDGSSRKPTGTVLYQSRLLSLQELLPECADRVPKCVPVAHAVMHLIFWEAIPGLFAVLGETWRDVF